MKKFLNLFFQKLFTNKVTKFVLSKAGFYLYNVKKNYPSTFREELERFEWLGREKEWRQIIFYSHILSLIQDVPGDIAEFGVASGTSFKAFSRITDIFNKNLPHNIAKKSVFGFDSFDGLGKLDCNDVGSNNQNIKKGLYESRACLNSLKEFVTQTNNCFLIEGLFEDTLENFIEKNNHITFCLIHIDCDLYKPTIFVLEKVVPRLNIGGIILFDEIFNEIFPGETKAFLDFYNNSSLRATGIRLEFHRVNSSPSRWYCIRTE